MTGRRGAGGASARPPARTCGAASAAHFQPPDAGCVFDVPSDYAEERMGGSANANAAALKDSDRILVEQLAAWSRE